MSKKGTAGANLDTFTLFKMASSILKLGDELKMINKPDNDIQPYHTQCVLTLESITAKYAAEVIGLEFSLL